jgi:hypothetical protein
MTEHVCITPCTTFDVTNFTDGNITGTGTFDVMMASAREHLKLEYEAGRITGDRFADVYLATMGQVLQTANQYALMQTKVDYEIAILSRQAVQLEEQTAGIIASNLNIVKQGLAIDKGVELTTAQIAKINKDSLLVDENISLTQKQELKIVQDTAYVVTQDTNATLDGLNIPKQGFALDKNIEQMTAQTANVVLDGVNIIKQGTNLDKSIEVSDAQIAKTSADKELTDQQTLILQRQEGFGTMR